MTAVLRSPPHLPSSPSSPLPCNPSDRDRTLLSPHEEELDLEQERKREVEQLSLLALLLTLVRKSLALGCRTGREDGIRSMEIGWPTEVRHVAHVTFDRFHGFLGLPVEFEPEVPRRAPSASASVFGVSTESMQCSYDPRGNSIPTILLLMQWRLYAQGGLQAEGIFRINAENSQEENVRDLLNSGIVPDGIDVHCLAGLIKAWFRELPTGVLDSLAPEQVMQCESEDECAHLVKLLPPTEAALLDWAINLMADVVQEEHHNKMNARNVAMVFAPNMTQMADPLTALMYAVQVMNFLKMLILRTLKGRQELVSGAASASHSGPSDENGHYSPKLQLEPCREEPAEHTFVCEEPISASPTHQPEETATTDDAADGFQTCRDTDHPVNGPKAVVQVKFRRNKTSQPIDVNAKKASRRVNAVRSTASAEKSRGISIVSRINTRSERVEAWR